MRLRKKPWVSEALLEYSDIVLVKDLLCAKTLEAGANIEDEMKKMSDRMKGCWHEIFGRTAPLHVELGTGKGKFISEMAERHPEINFVGIESQQDVLFYVAKKVREKNLTNVRLLVFDVNHLLEIFNPQEIDRLYINFCDPWPKVRHAKRRLTHAEFLEKYRIVLAAGGEIFFKTDNRILFDFSLEQITESGLQMDKVTFDLHNSDFTGNIMTEYETKFSGLGTKINRCEIKFP
ncbi:tRNA (guanine-N(7)-)-methyltransferase [Candidatus Desulfosporosinus infrequens]|uniref:tRNA (guanine-N(7)-)-methyltransferase n=1 Tax=Candidatus Desulfosporosinus infrequens TaxID=2043169 RepID=A0A2U3LU66_9FIRM|nr:tRNA (guanine-N(7)-)-methyltransferase [Candidatus Desulfosporosinus infrequens]